MHGAHKTLAARRESPYQPIESFIAQPLAERLEARLMLSTVKGGPLAKMEYNLQSAYQEYAAALNSGKISRASQYRPGNLILHTDNAGKIAIEAYAQKNSSAALAADLKAAGATQVRIFERAIDAFVPVSAIPAVAGSSHLRFAQAVTWGTDRETTVPPGGTDSGSVNAQSDTALRAINARSTYGVNGSGVKVGVISDSFNALGAYSTDVASGDLPSGVQTIEEGPANGTDEGRAMAQIIYDEAPGASLAFATGVNGLSDFAANVTSLKNAGCKVIVDDIYYPTESFFQDSVLAQAIDTASAAGISYFASAGNYANYGYDSAWRSGLSRGFGSIASVSGAPTFWGGATFDFDPGPGVDDMQSFTLSGYGAVYISLQWDSPFYSVSGGAGSANDLDFYLLNASGTQVVAGSTSNNTGDDAVEYFYYRNPSASAQIFNLMISKYSGADPGQIKYVDFRRGVNSAQFATNTATMTGHRNAAGARAVAAAAYSSTPAYGTSPPVIEWFSSQGPASPILFDNTGTRLATPINRDRPYVTGVDGVDTTLPSSSGLNPFYGTSAAAPSIAGIAALLLSKKPALTPDQVYTALQTSAIDMDNPFTTEFDSGYDTRTGWGLAQADAAMAWAVTPAPPSVPDLVASSDSGPSSTDNITSDTTPTFSGTAQAGATITIRANGSAVGSGAASSAGNWNITSAVLGNGVWSITATATADGQTSAPSDALSVTVDTIAPTVNSWSFNYLSAQRVAVVFSEDVGNSLAVGDVTFANLTNANTYPGLLSYDPATATGTFSFGVILPDGNYRGSLAAGAISDLAGNPLAATSQGTFFVLAADANRDRAVDVTDLGVLATNWQGIGKNFSQADFNYDGKVDVTDLGILATNWQKTLPEPLISTALGFQTSAVRAFAPGAGTTELPSIQARSRPRRLSDDIFGSVGGAMS